MNVGIKFEYKIGEIVEARNAYYGQEFDECKVMHSIYKVDRDGSQIIYNVKNLKHKNRFNCTKHNIRKCQQ